MKQKASASRSRNRRNEPPAQHRFEARPPMDESCCGAAVLDREEKTDKIRIPALLRAHDLLEIAKVVSPPGFKPMDFFKTIKSAEYGECCLMKASNDGAEPAQHKYLGMVDQNKVKWVLTAVPEEVSTIISDGKIFLTIGEELYCLTKADGI